MNMNEFYKNFREQILLLMDTQTSGWEQEDFLTSLMLEYLEEAGEVDNPIICPFRGYGLQLNAYSISDDYENVDIIVTIYSNSETPESVARNDIDASIKIHMILP